MGEAPTDRVVEALDQGAVWLPQEAIARHPPLLGALLEQALRVGAERRQASVDRIDLRDCQARVDRLLGLLWEAVPGEGPSRWFTQRSMLERLDEEVARSRRYGGPLSVVLGELRTETGSRLPPAQAHLAATWMAERVAREKRRCDVAGQYGLHGFILLLPQSPEAEARGACRRLGALLDHPPHPDLPPLHACFGLASVPADDPSVPGLLRRAEERLSERMKDEG